MRSFLAVLPMVFCVVSLFWIILSQRRIIGAQYQALAKLAKAQMELERHVVLLYSLTDVLHFGLCNPFYQSIYLKIRGGDVEDIPDTKEKHLKLIRDVTMDNYNRVKAIVTERLAKTEDPAEKEFFQNKMEKLNEVVNMVAVIDENSSNEFIQIAIGEVQKSIRELMEG